MKIPTKEFFQRKGRPAVQALLESDHAQDGLIRRAGQPDVPIRVVLMPWSDEGKQGARPDAPEFRSVAWFGLFDHTAPVKEARFSVIAQDGTVFTPDSPAENAGNADVAWFLRLTPIAKRTRTETLVFTLPGQGTSVDPATGNPIPVPGTPLAVQARLVVSNDPKVIERVGADEATVVLIGRWGSLEGPLPRPEGVKWGSTSPLTLDGQRGTLTVKLAYPDADLWQEQQFGQRFLATWEAR